MRKYGLDHTFQEHLADSVVHVVGVAVALVGATALVVWAVMAAPREHIMPLIVYAFGLIATFSLSAAYNITVHKRSRDILRRFDHAAIFVMIASTYTPLALIGIGGVAGITLAALAWGIAALGVFLKLFYFHRFDRVTFALYLVHGWLAVLAVVPMMREIPVAILVLIVIGGMIYTLGTLFHRNDGWAYNRAIWHGLVLMAASLHYSAVFAVASSP